MRKFVIVLAACAVGSSACGVETRAQDAAHHEETPGAEPVSRSSAAFSTFTDWEITTLGEGLTYLPLSGTSVATQTCFLSGLAGNLPLAGGGVLAGDSEWELFTNGQGTDPNRMLEDWAVCVPSPNVGVPWGWTSGDAPQLLSSTSSSGHPIVCGLTTVAGTNWGRQPGGFTSLSDQVQIFQSNGSWYLGGSGPGWLTVNSACAEVTTVLGNWSITWTGGPQWWPLDLPSGAQCLLTGVSGSFQDDQNWNDGAFLEYYDGQWYAYVDGNNGLNPKGIQFTCVQ